MAFVRERISSVQYNLPKRSMCSVDDTITFPLINVNRVLQPHEDALVLTLGISGFNVRKVLIDPNSSANLLQMLTYKQMGFPPSALENPRQLLFGFNGAMMNFQGDVVYSSRLARSP